MQQTNSLDSTVSSFLYTLRSAAGDYLSCLGTAYVFRVLLSQAAVCWCECVQEGSEMYCMLFTIRLRQPALIAHCRREQQLNMPTSVINTQ